MTTVIGEATPFTNEYPDDGFAVLAGLQETPDANRAPDQLSAQETDWQQDPIYLSATPDVQAKYTAEQWCTYIAGVRHAARLRVSVPVGVLGAGSHCVYSGQHSLSVSSEQDNNRFGRLF